MPFGQYHDSRVFQDYRSDEIPDPRVKLDVGGYQLDVAIEGGTPVEGEDGVLKDVMIFTSGRVLMVCTTTGNLSNSPIALASPKYDSEISDVAILVAARAAGILPEALEYSVH